MQKKKISTIRRFYEMLSKALFSHKEELSITVQVLSTILKKILSIFYGKLYQQIPFFIYSLPIALLSLSNIIDICFLSKKSITAFLFYFSIEMKSIDFGNFISLPLLCFWKKSSKT